MFTKVNCMLWQRYLKKSTTFIEKMALLVLKWGKWAFIQILSLCLPLSPSLVYKWRKPGAAAGQWPLPVLECENPSVTGHCSRASLPAQQGHLPPRPHLQGTVVNPDEDVGWCRKLNQWSCLHASICPDKPTQNCLVRCESGAFTAVVGDFGLAEKIPDYRWVWNILSSLRQAFMNELHWEDHTHTHTHAHIHLLDLSVCKRMYTLHFYTAL